MAVFASAEIVCHFQWFVFCMCIGFGFGFGGSNAQLVQKLEVEKVLCEGVVSDLLLAQG